MTDKKSSTSLSVPRNKWQPDQPTANYPVSLRESTPEGDRNESQQPGSESEECEQLEQNYYCAECDGLVTDIDEEISVGGGFEHTFANPKGLVFRIGCFDSAVGCASTGRGHSEFCWFDGYLWYIGLCRSCGTHLGWQFRDAENDGFWGLILPRLHH